MYRLTELPPAFKRYDEIGGVIDFAIFEDSDGSEPDIIEGVRTVLPQQCTFDPQALRAIGNRSIWKRELLGDWWAPETRALIKVGDWTTSKGESLHNPQLKMLEGVRIISGAFSPPEPGSGGQFAFAFLCPPYSLEAQPAEVQQIFDELLDFILPRKQASDVRDWSSPRLPQASDYFSAGMEWWGVFLFSLYIFDLRRLTIAMASTTD